MKIGVISDTHNYLDPKVLTVFKGVDHILHGGDIGNPTILSTLEEIAPVTAVIGNTDDAVFQYPLTQTVTLANRKFLVHHIVNPMMLEDSLASTIGKENPHVVVFGHTHKPFAQRIRSILFFNPGYAGKSRFNMERSVAIIHCSSDQIRHEYIAL